MTESAHLIWKLRCERIIQEEDRPFTEEEIENRWLRTINGRLELDQKMTDKDYGPKAIPKSKVLETWRSILKDEKALPDDWTGENGVLVGS